MNIYISTNMYKPSELEKIFQLIRKVNDPSVGIELFPEWHDNQFIYTLRHNLDKLKKSPSTLHGPYYYTEHSKKKGTIEYERAQDYFKRTLELGKKINSKYIVYHHNNCEVKPEDRIEMVKTSTENLMELNALSKEYNIDIVVENAGVISRNNVLFNEQEFTEMARSIDNSILIDVGHAFANNWNLVKVISELKDKILSYHLHNNNGVEDNHNRIRDGKLNMDDFFQSHAKYTPDAALVIEYGKNCSRYMEDILEDVKEIKKMTADKVKISSII